MSRHPKDMTFMSEPCFVYALMDPFEDEPFYIGISNNPWSRFYGHQHDPCSAAYHKIRELIEDGFSAKSILLVLGEMPTREKALFVERGLIQEFPKLLNRENRRRAA